MAGTGKKILILEDDPAMRDIVVHKLLANGFEIKEAGDGKVGLDMTRKEKPDLVILDLMMPKVDGFQYLETIRADKDPSISQTKVIVLSNLWSNKDILRTKDLNISAYMVKAYFTTEEILKKVQEVLK